jgi:hypothetical protein
VEDILGVPVCVVTKLKVPDFVASDQILEIQPNVIMPEQLPGNISKVISQQGQTRNSTSLLCKCDNGQVIRVSRRQLSTILGKDRVDKLCNDNLDSSLTL